MAYDLSTRFDYLGTRFRELNQNFLLYQRPVKQPPEPPTIFSSPVIVIPNFTHEKLDVTQLAAYGVVLITDKAQDVVFDFSKLSTLSPTRPVEGDRLYLDGRQYEVFSVGDEIYRFATSSRKRIRVHTKEIVGNLTLLDILLDEDGMPILDEDGFLIPVDRGFVLDEDGNLLLDEDGNPIPIE